MSSHNTMAKYKNFDPKHSFYRREPLHSRASDEKSYQVVRRLMSGPSGKGQGRKLGEDPKKKTFIGNPASFLVRNWGENQIKKSLCRESG